MDEDRSQNYKSAIEALLFVSEKPVVLDQLKEVFPELKPSQIHDLIKQLQEEYVNREAGMVVVEIAGGFQMLSNSQVAGYIRVLPCLTFFGSGSGPSFALFAVAVA